MRWSRRAATAAQGAGVGLLPVVICAALALHFFSASARQAIPLENDEVGYWSQVAAFREAGFNGGYFVINERPSPAAFSRFGPHGPVFPTIYGMLARLTGWRPYTAPIYGAVLLVAAALVWWVRSRPPRAAIAAVLVASFWPLILYVPTTMQEPLHFAFAFLFAALVSPLVRTGTLSKAAVVAFAACMVGASLVRPTWALLMIPVAEVATTTGRRSVRTAAMIGAAAAAVVLYVAFAALAAPYPLGTGSSVVPAISQADPMAFARILIRRAVPNAIAFLTPSHDQLLQVFLRYQFVLVMLAVIVRTRRRPVDAADRFVLSWMAITFVAVLLVGDVEGWRDYRLLGPVLLCAALVACAHGHSWPAWVAAANIAVAPIATQVFIDLHHDRFLADVTRIQYFRRDVAPVVRYEPEVSGWGNTLLMHVDAYQNYLVGLPAGIGLASAMHWDQLTLPIKSRYVLVRPIDRTSLPDGLRLRQLAETSVGTVYENLDWRR